MSRMVKIRRKKKRRLQKSPKSKGIPEILLEREEGKKPNPDKILQLQRTIGNQAVLRQLEGKKQPTPTIQRLMTYKQFYWATWALGKRNESKWLTLSYKNYLQDAPGLTDHRKLVRLKQLIQLCDGYLDHPKRQKSKRRKGIIKAKNEMLAEIESLKKDLTGDEFTEGNIDERQREVLGGQMNKLDYIKYSFGMTQVTDDSGTVTDKKIEGGSFEGYFKPNVESDPILGRTRGPWTGIQEDNPRYAERAVATYELAKLLDPSLIPPTFLAKHTRNGEVKLGQMMEKVEGETGNKSTANKNDPIFRQAMSKLMMLDFICGQVDRHPGNYIIQTDGTKVVGVVGIDNDLAFGDKFTDLTYGGGAFIKNPDLFKRMVSAGGNVTALNEIDRAFAEKIILLVTQTDKITKALQSLLSDGEIAATISRLTALANFLRPLVTSNDDKIVSKWE
jgi:hypothetical protein